LSANRSDLQRSVFDVAHELGEYESLALRAKRSVKGSKPLYRAFY
jgi:hypothetical protein